MTAATELVSRFITLIIDPAILLVFTAGFLLFLWGLVVFMSGVGDDTRGNTYQEGRQHMLWGLVGMFIMVSVYGILALIDNTFSLHSTNPDTSRMENILPAANFFGGGQ